MDRIPSQMILEFCRLNFQFEQPIVSCIELPCRGLGSQSIFVHCNLAISTIIVVDATTIECQTYWISSLCEMKQRKLHVRILCTKITTLPNFLCEYNIYIQSEALNLCFSCQLPTLQHFVVPCMHVNVFTKGGRKALKFHNEVLESSQYLNNLPQAENHVIVKMRICLCANVA